MRDHPQSILALLFCTERAQLIRVASRITRCRADAEDVVQAAFVRAAEQADQVSIQHMRGWLHVVVRRLAIDAIRSSTRFVHADIHRMLAATNDDTVVEPRWAHLSLSDLHVMTKHLPTAMQHTFSLWWAGASYESIALAQRIPVGTVASRVLRAKARLRALCDSVSRSAPQRTGRASSG
jgi:RNA polymerase sigma-70 factor, ECF subfamily